MMLNLEHTHMQKNSLYLSDIIFHIVYYVNCYECGRREPPALCNSKILHSHSHDFANAGERS